MISFIKSKPAIYVYVSCLNLITDFDHLWSFAMSWSSLLILKKSGFRSSKFAWSVWYETCDKYAKKKKKERTGEEAKYLLTALYVLRSDMTEGDWKS